MTRFVKAAKVDKVAQADNKVVAPADIDKADSPIFVCLRCGADDRDLIEWGDGSYVCDCCYACQICGGNGSELIDWNGFGNYICIDCRKQTKLEQQDGGTSSSKRQKRE